MDGLIQRGDVWWVDLPSPQGSEAGFRRPMLVVQADSFNELGLRTIVSLPLTSNLSHGGRAWTVELDAAATGLPKPSVVLPHLVQAVERSLFRSRAGRLAPGALEQVFAAMDVVLGR